MKITAFNKTVEIDENNKGINYYFKTIGVPFDEITIVFWYRLRNHISTEQAAEELRKMSAKKMKESILQSIREAIKEHGLDTNYIKYV